MRSSETMKIRPICIQIRFLLSLLFLFGALAFPAAPSVHQAQPRSMLQPPLPQKTIPPSILDLEIRDTQTASISNAFPTAAAAATTANALTNPYCSYLDSVLSVCNFATPGFSSYSPAYQAECLCYVDGIWEPFLFDGEISMCVGYLIAQTTGDRASMVDIMTLMGLCFSVGNVKTCTYTGSDVSSCSAGEASASSRATSSEPAASSSNAAASQSNAAESFLTSIPTITSGTIYTSSQSLPIPPLTPIPTIIYGTQSLPIPPLTPIPTIIYWTIYTSSQSFNTNSMPTAISSKDLTGATPTTTNISSRPIGILDPTTRQRIGILSGCGGAAFIAGFALFVGLFKKKPHDSFESEDADEKSPTSAQTPTSSTGLLPLMYGPGNEPASASPSISPQSTRSSGRISIPRKPVPMYERLAGHDPFESSSTRLGME